MAKRHPAQAEFAALERSGGGTFSGLPGSTFRHFRTREEWRNARRSALGSSDAAAIIGVSGRKSGTPLNVWLSKREDVDDPERDDEWLRWGHIHESNIAAEYARRTGAHVINLAPKYGHHIVSSNAHPMVAASLDRLQYRSDREGPGILEMKTTVLGGDWKDEPPIEPLVQVHHQSLATGIKWGTIAVLIAGSRMLTFDFNVNEAFAPLLLRRLLAFWENHVLAEVPPPPTAFDSAALARLYPEEDPGSAIALEPKTFTMPSGDVVTVDPAELLAARYELTRHLSAVEAKVDMIDAYLRAILGRHERGVLPDGSYVRWKTTKSYTVPERTVPSSRRFGVHVPKAIKAAREAMTTEAAVLAVPASLPSCVSSAHHDNEDN